MSDLSDLCIRWGDERVPSLDVWQSPHDDSVCHIANGHDITEIRTPSEARQLADWLNQWADQQEDSA